MSILCVDDAAFDTSIEDEDSLLTFNVVAFGEPVSLVPPS